jgi:hypothetical protein
VLADLLVCVGWLVDSYWSRASHAEVRMVVMQWLLTMFVASFRTSFQMHSVVLRTAIWWVEG